MVELGQPMHAQDLAKMKAPEIVIRKAKREESVKTLLGETIKVDGGQFVLTQKGIPTVIGGIVGGASTGVDDKTADIVLDAGNYDQNNVRKSSRKLKIQNETVLRYDKFLHPKLTEIAIARATKLILDLAGGEYYENIDWYPKKSRVKKMDLRMSRIEAIGGMKINIKRVKEILESLEYKVLAESNKGLNLEVPYFRTDVEVEDDLVSDVLRISDYEKIPISLINRSPPKEITPDIYNFENKVKDVCVSLGLHEHITNPLVSRESNNDKQVLLENALSSEQNAVRTNVYDTLFPITGSYKSRGCEEIGLFEIGRIYNINASNKGGFGFKEIRVLEVIYHAKKKPHEVVPHTKVLLNGVLNNLGIENVEYKKSKNKTN